ncbi:hypothetical protein OJF2_37960 [Aquisphaera giovannonii]|uniref:Oxalate:formate antiporter n=1 Tax=Aquisphaera giovannonii TaxID=406548 RepID=A0A5B9W4T3_9BACT|nr:hypothetical protein [Aquisphaera giovannonii]QEH35249.1 hypothetical protein OJF2_37960 [Aquisphaera giovannonii]
MADTERKTSRESSTLRIAASWLLVLIPLGWGVVQSVAKSVPLFRASSAPGTPPANAGR